MRPHVAQSKTIQGRDRFCGHERSERSPPVNRRPAYQQEAAVGEAQAISRRRRFNSGNAPSAMRMHADEGSGVVTVMTPFSGV
jgi:hypothetical protein